MATRTSRTSSNRTPGRDLLPSSPQGDKAQLTEAGAGALDAGQESAPTYAGVEAESDDDLRRIVHIRIRNVLGIESADLPVGDGLIFTGPNEACKTAFLHALRAVFDKNARTQMVRWGENEGNVVLFLDDGTEARRRITDGEMQEPVVFRPDRSKWSSPVSVLQKLAPAFLVNPVQFVNMKAAAQVQLLAKVFGIQPKEGEIEAICGPDVDLREIRPDADGLTRISKAHDAAYDARHGANAELESITAAFNAEKAKIPQGFDADAVRSVSTASLAKQLAEITQHNQSVETGGRQLAELTRQQGNLSREIEECAARMETLIRQRGELEGRVARGQEWLQQHPSIDTGPITAQIQDLDKQRALLLAYDTAQALDLRVTAAKVKADRLQHVVTRLKALKVELVQRADIPIDGVSLDPKGIRVRGLPLDNLSQGAQYTVAIRVAAAGARNLRFICIDGAEALCRELRQQLLREFSELKFQVFMTQVSDDFDFSVLDLDGHPVQADIRLAPVGQVTRGAALANSVPHVDAPGSRSSAPTAIHGHSSAELDPQTSPEAPLFSESAATEPNFQVDFGALSI